MAKKRAKTEKPARRIFDREFKLQAVKMMLDGYSASSVADRQRKGAKKRGQVSFIEEKGSLKKRGH